MAEGLFEDPTTSGAPRRAPRDLNPGEWRELRRWAEARVPWVTRGAFGGTTSLEEHVDACLSYFRQTKKMRAGWLETVENWIRRDERARVERLAKAGNEQARLALRDPDAWRSTFDRVARMGRPNVDPAPELIVPREPHGGARVLSLRRPSAS